MLNITGADGTEDSWSVYWANVESVSWKENVLLVQIGGRIEAVIGNHPLVGRDGSDDRRWLIVDHSDG